LGGLTLEFFATFVTITAAAPDPTVKTKDSSWRGTSATHMELIFLGFHGTLWDFSLIYPKNHGENWDLTIKHLEILGNSRTKWRCISGKKTSMDGIDKDFMWIFDNI
jgi:hypothetical protein